MKLPKVEMRHLGASSRSEAREKGLTQYWTGKPCNRGHVAARSTISAGCMECHRIKVNIRRKANKEIGRRHNKRMYAKYKHKYIVYNRNRRARLAGAPGTHTREDILKLFDNQDGLCNNPACKVGLVQGYHVDHMVPVSRGGSNDPGNLQLLCRSCNDSKGTKTPEEWYGCP